MHRCCVNPIMCKLFTAAILVFLALLFTGLIIAFARAVLRAKSYGESESLSTVNEAGPYDTE